MTPRWKVTVYYRSDSGLLDVVYYLEEIADLHDRVEKGPHWDTISTIRVERINRQHKGLTVEQACHL